MKKVIVIVMALAIMICMTGCSLFTEKAHVYTVNEDGSRTLTDIYTYDSEGYMTSHLEVVDG